MELNFKRITGGLMLTLFISLGANFYQQQTHEKQQENYRETITILKEKNLTYEKDNEEYLNYLTSTRSQDDGLKVEQQRAIKTFCLNYFTFSSVDEGKRIESVASVVSEDLKKQMEKYLDEGDHELENHHYQLTLSASDVKVYTGNTNEYLAMFRVTYSSDITLDVHQIYAIKFVMDGDKIMDYTILSVQDEEVMKHV